MLIPEPGPNEKRSFCRMTMNTPLTFTFQGEGRDCTGFCKDLSHTGVRFTTELNPSKETQLEITIDTKYHGFEPFKAKVEILRSEYADNKYTVAGRFLSYN